MRQRLQQLGKDSVTYGIGGILARSIGFFLLPVYTRIFTPADYGTIEMFMVLNGFLGTLLDTGMTAAQSFYFFQLKNQDIESQSKVITAILQWRLLWGAISVFLAILFSPILNRIFFSDQLSWEYFAIAFVGTFFTQVMSQGVEIFRLIYKPWNYIGINLGNTVVSAIVAFTLIIGFNAGIMGFLLGSMIGAILTAGIVWYQNRTYLQLSYWHKSWWPRLLRFGIPLLPAGLSMYVLNTSDRWFISYYHDSDILGLYAVGARFSTLLTLAVTTFRQAWWPTAMDSMHSEDGAQLFRTVARFYVGLGTALTVILTAISPLLLRWFTVPAYYSAYPIVGILAWSSLSYGFFLIASAGIWKREKTHWNPILMGGAALLNIGLDICLVPEYSALGAAIATSITFLVWNIITLLISEKFWKVEYPLGILSSQIGFGLISCIGILVLYHYRFSIFPILLLVIFSLIILALLTKDLRSLKRF